MIEIAITEKMIADACMRLNPFDYNNINKGPHSFGSDADRTFFGYLGEEMVQEYLAAGPQKDTFNYDLVHNGKRLECKSISCKAEPKGHYLCTVNSSKLEGLSRQEADFYVFCRIKNNCTQGWILGSIPCDEFFKKGRYVPKGGWAAPGIRFDKAHGTVLEINELHQLPREGRA